MKIGKAGSGSVTTQGVSATGPIRSGTGPARFVRRPSPCGTAPPHKAEKEVASSSGPIHVEIMSSPIKDKAGNNIAAVEIVRDITERKRLEKEKEELIASLTQTLEKVKVLSGLIPICANCKQIRDDRGFWSQVEVYIRDHSEAEFTHSICPACARELYGGYGILKKG